MQSMLFHSQLNSMNNWVVVITTGGQMEGKQWIIFKLWQSHHGNTTQGNANKLDRFKRTMQLCGIHHSLTTLLKYIIFNEIYLFFAALLRPISITHCMHLNFHCGVSIAGTWSYPSLSPSLTQRNTVCICKHRSSPNQIFFFKFQQEERWMQVILFFLPKKKTTLERETFFIMRTLQPNIMPIKEEGSLFFLHECSYFTLQTDKKKTAGQNTLAWVNINKAAASFY